MEDTGVESVRGALHEVAGMLEADGYGLVVSDAADGAVSIAIVALAGACEDCLVPKAVMKELIRESLPPEAADFDLSYPGDA